MDAIRAFLDVDHRLVFMYLGTCADSFLGQELIKTFPPDQIGK